MPSFARFLAQPWVLGLQDLLFECVDHTRGGPTGLRTHDWYHIEPQARCLVGATGRPAVDFILRCALTCWPCARAKRRIESQAPCLLGACGLNVGNYMLRCARACWVH